MRGKAILVMLVLFTLYLVLTTIQAEEKKMEMWEMKTYYLVLLLKGPNRGQNSTQAIRIQEEHLAHLTKCIRKEN